MKAVFITFNQSYYVQLIDLFDELAIKGFSFWEQVQGRGSVDGEPHYGSHAWPTLNSAMIVILENEKVSSLMEALAEMDAASKKQGLRAFVWNIEQSL